MLKASFTNTVTVGLIGMGLCFILIILNKYLDLLHEIDTAWSTRWEKLDRVNPNTVIFIDEMTLDNGGA